MPIRGVRGGLTSPYWLGPHPYHFELSHQRDGVHITFRLSAKGGGTTVVNLCLESDTFEALGKAMMSADARSAIRAFGATLQAGLPEII
jgi:hypothetical protein